jgi:hypothetical protein
MVAMTTRPLSLLLPLLLAAALALAACGSSGGPGGSAGASDDDKNYEAALKFSQCMRDHGVDMPDPQRGAGGGIIMQRGSSRGSGPEKGLDGPDAKTKAAEQACRRFLPKGGGRAPSPAEQAKARDAFVGYARCMRGKGINMPDPQFEGNGIKMSLGPGVRPDSATFKAADKACHPILAAVEPKGAKVAQGAAGGAQ